MSRGFGKPASVCAALVALLGLAFAGPTAGPANADAEGDLIHTPTAPDEFDIYARVIRLAHAGTENGRLLATFEHAYEDGSPGSFIKRSDDDGVRWSTLATVEDPLTGPGHPVSRMWQPYLFEFPRELGGYPAGTLMLVGNMVPIDGSFTQLTATLTPSAGGPATRLEYSDPYDSFPYGMVGLRDHAGTASFRRVDIDPLVVNR